MTPSPDIAQDLDAYAQWTAGIWMGDAQALTERDFTIMSLGLGGEGGEVAEIFAHLDTFADPFTAPALDRALATKELGDTLYYWARICEAFGLSARAAARAGWAAHHTAQSAPWDLDELAQGFTHPRDASAFGCLLAACKLSTNLGKIQEILKKRVRDDHFKPEQLFLALGEAFGSWARLCLALGLVPSAVAQANHDKIEDRKARGVMRGNGNDR